MEILTLLKANIRHKKGAFLCTLILTFVIVATAVTVLGVRNNYFTALDNAHEYSEVGNSNVFIADRLLTDELLKSVEENKSVASVKIYDAIASKHSNKAGRKEDNNEYFVQKMRDGFKLYNKQEDAFEDKIPELKKGEIYLPLGLKSKLSCNIGDTIEVGMSDRTYNFKIKGFLQEPTMGAMMMGWKQVFVSDEQYDEIKDSCAKYETDTYTCFYKLLRIYKSDQSISDAKFQRELNLETGIISNAVGSLTMEQSKRYTGLFLEIITGVMLGFVAVLFFIVLVVIGHGIKTEIEIDYVNLGILKSQGFDNGKITLLIVLRNILGEIAGIVAGILVGIPLEDYLSRVFLPITAIMPDDSFAFIQILVLVAGILFLSVLLIIMCTRKVTNISPIRAISGGKNEVYFSSRLNAKISPKLLLSSLAVRNFTSNVRRYMGVIFIMALLTFFTVTVNIMADAIKSRTSLEAMGYIMPDLSINFTADQAHEHIEDFEKIVEKYTDISTKYYMRTEYLSLNGENLYAEIYKEPKVIPGLVKGRLPLYENEVVITEMVADLLELKMGDEVSVRGKNDSATYIISGIYQTPSDSGMAFAMSFDAAKKIGIDKFPYMGMVLENSSANKKIAKELNSKYGDIIIAEAIDAALGTYEDTFELGAFAMQIMIYVFSVVFALVTVIMVCSKAFAQERIDIGIYKAMGFTTNQLRLQFAIRFLVLSAIGGVIGAVAGALFSDDVLNIVFGLFGISKVVSDNTVLTFATAIGMICICVFIFAYVVSGKIKRVEIKELVID